MVSVKRQGSIRSDTMPTSTTRPTAASTPPASFQIVLDPDVIKWVVAKLQSVGDVEVRTFPLASLADLRVRAGSTKELTR